MLLVLGLLLPMMASTDMRRVPFVERVAESEHVVLGHAQKRGAEIELTVDRALKGAPEHVLRLPAHLSQPEKYIEDRVPGPPFPIGRRVLVLLAKDGVLGAYPEGSREMKHAPWIVDTLASHAEPASFVPAMAKLTPEEVTWLHQEVFTSLIPEPVRVHYLELAFKQASPSWEMSLFPLPSALELSAAVPALLAYLRRGGEGFRSGYPIEVFRTLKDPRAEGWLIDRLERGRAEDDANRVPAILSVIEAFSPELYACLLRQLDAEGLYPASSARRIGESAKWVKEEATRVGQGKGCEERLKLLFPVLDAQGLGEKPSEPALQKLKLFQLSVRAEPASVAATILLEKSRASKSQDALTLLALAAHALRRAHTLPPALAATYRAAVDRAWSQPYGDGVEAVVVAVAQDALSSPQEAVPMLTDAWGNIHQRANALLVVSRLNLTQLTSPVAATLGAKLLELADQATSEPELRNLGAALAVLSPVTPEILKGVETRLAASSSKTRNVGVRLLAHLPQAPAADWDRVVREANQLEDSDLRANAVTTLTTAAWVTRDTTRADRTLPILWTRLDDSDSKVSRAAAQGLGMLSYWKPAAGKLAEIPETLTRRIESLGDMSPSKRDVTLLAVKGIDPKVFSSAAVERLAKVGQRWMEASDADLRRSGLFLIGALDLGQLPAAVAATWAKSLGQLTASKDDATRANAAYSLGQLGRVAASERLALERLLTDPNPAVRANVVHAIVLTTDDHNHAVRAILPLCADQDKEVRAHCISVLHDVAKDPRAGLDEAVRKDLNAALRKAGW